MVLSIQMVCNSEFNSSISEYIHVYLGQHPPNIRSISFLVRQVPSLSWLSGWIPGFLKLPYWLFHQASNKF